MRGALLRAPLDPGVPLLLPTPTMPTPTVLLVDDDSAIRQLYRDALNRYGYRTLEARDGTEGLRMAQEAAPDLVVTDLGMSGLNGWDLTQRIKSNPQTAHLPVVVLTVHPQEIHRMHAERVGCDAFLAKPKSPRVLRDEIERLLARSAD